MPMRRRVPLGRRLLVFVVLFSIVAAAALIVTSSRKDAAAEWDRLDSVAEQIKLTSLEPIGLALWNFETEGLQRTLDGLAGLQDVKRVEVFDGEGEPVAGAEAPGSEDKTAQEFWLKHAIEVGDEKNFTLDVMFDNEGTPEKVGELKITLTTHNALTRLQDKIESLALTELGKMAGFAFFFLLLVRFFVTAVLGRMSQFLRNMDRESENIEDRVFPGSKRGLVTDEIDELVESFNDLSKENLHFVNEIREINRGLEQRVRERTQELAQKNVEIRSIFDSLTQGIFKINSQWNIVGDHSDYLKTIFGFQDISEFSFESSLLDRAALSEDALSYAKASLEASFGVGITLFEVNQEGLPQEFAWTSPSGDRKHLELSWSPLADASGEVTELVVTIRDVTLLKELESLNKANEEELMIISELLQSDAAEFRRFHKNCSEQFAEARELLYPALKWSQEAAHPLFRVAHTIKGNARTKGYARLSEFVHVWEDRIQKVRDGVSDASQSYDTLVEHFRMCEAEFTRYRNIAESKLHYFGNSRGASFTKELLSLLQDQPAAQSAEEILARVLKMVESEVSNAQPTVVSFLQTLRKEVADTAQLAGKPTPHLQVFCPKELDLPLSEAGLSLFQSSFVHLASNAVDHGIESAEERRSFGKEETGQLRIEVLRSGPHVEVLVRDDGAGLRLDDIQQRAREKSLLSAGAEPTPETLAQVLLLPGFSTKESVSQLSGRGVGLDVVCNEARKLGGDLDLVPTPQDVAPVVPPGCAHFSFVLKIPFDALFDQAEQNSTPPQAA